MPVHDGWNKELLRAIPSGKNESGDGGVRIVERILQDTDCTWIQRCPRQPGQGKGEEQQEEDRSRGQPHPGRTLEDGLHPSRVRAGGGCTEAERHSKAQGPPGEDADENKDNDQGIPDEGRHRIS